jgi:hypothetical protein
MAGMPRVFTLRRLKVAKQTGKKETTGTETT